MRAARRIVRLCVAIAAGGVLLVAAAGVGRAEDGKAIYDKSCVSCHGATGQGDGPAGKMLKPPPGPFAAATKGKSDAEMAALVKDGRKEAGRNHPGYGAKLNEAQIKAVVDYVKTLAAK